MQQLADAINIIETERGACAFYRQQRLTSLVQNDGGEQHYQADDDNTAASCRRLFQPETQHQAAHRQQGTGVKRPIIGDGDQPQEGLALYQFLVKEVENAGVNREPESVIHGHIPAHE